MKKLIPKQRRLAKEHIELHQLCERSDKIKYEITKQRGRMPPTGYRINYYVKSIVGVDDGRMPIYGNHHIVDIDIPTGYPIESITPFAKSDIWHPNIRWVGDLKGRVCTTAKHLSAGMSLDLLVLRIGEIIQYKNYLAENVEPWPEDAFVAQWVREVGEPKGIINYKEGKVIDDSELLKPLPGFEPRELPKSKPKPKIRITKKTVTVTTLPEEKSVKIKKGNSGKIIVRKRD
jgi:ubiquitin-protein ligase